MSDPETQDGSFRLSVDERPFANLVALHVRWTGNRIVKKFPLSIILEVDEHHITIPLRRGFFRRRGSFPKNLEADALRLRIRLRQCYVRCKSTELRIVPETKYESVIAFGDLKVRNLTKAESARKTRLGGRFGGKMILDSDNARVALNVGAAASSDARDNRREDTVVDLQPDIFEIQAVPNGWRVGHPQYGDPYELSGCLVGRYFDRPVPGMPQTCEAEFVEGHDTGRLTFMVTVRDGIHVERVDGIPVNPNTAELAKARMRDRIAELRIERYLRTAESEVLRADSEMPIAIVSYDVSRGDDRLIDDPPRSEERDTSQIRSRRSR
jgi:hypothetical protein